MDSISGNGSDNFEERDEVGKEGGREWGEEDSTMQMTANESK